MIRYLLLSLVLVGCGEFPNSQDFPDDHSFVQEDGSAPDSLARDDSKRGVDVHSRHSSKTSAGAELHLSTAPATSYSLGHVWDRKHPLTGVYPCLGVAQPSGVGQPGIQVAK